MKKESVVNTCWESDMLDKARDEFSAAAITYQYTIKFKNRLKLTVETVDKEYAAEIIKIATRNFTEFETRLADATKNLLPVDRKRIIQLFRERFISWIDLIDIEELLHVWEDLKKSIQSI